MNRQQTIECVQEKLRRPEAIKLRQDLRLGAVNMSQPLNQLYYWVQAETDHALLAATSLMDTRIELRRLLTTIDESFPEIRNLEARENDKTAEDQGRADEAGELELGGPSSNSTAESRGGDAVCGAPRPQATV